jgi:endonuclease/exonuclease/phosphatase family metal-dependent hydrolase
MPKLTIATFNCENLFIRFKFGEKVKQSAIDNAVKNGFIKERGLFEFIFEKERVLTAKAIKDTKADIIALQEVENLDTLKSFQSRFLKLYPYQYLIDGNDPRFIDVSVLSKYEIKNLKTHQFDKSGSSKIFSRDCLEIDLDFKGAPLVLFINHFKSMLGGREQTMARRKKQSERVVQIIKDRFGSKPGTENFVVMGDLNDYLPSTGLHPLVGQPWVENVVQTRLPDGEKWTHWYSSEKSVSQLDYLLLSKRLADNNANAVPVVVRKGLAKNCTQYIGPRYPDVGPNRPSASDHCPVAITLNVQ